jgi:group II intron reverse transcriptase/maturase
MRLPTSLSTVQTLQTSLHVKAKTEPNFRFYSLWDKIARSDILREAYRRCRANQGAAGVDGETFARIETCGVERWLGHLQQELQTKQYRPEPLLRVWIPKSNGGQRPLGIATVRDRVVQMAVHLILQPIFEADLLPQQYGFRPRLDAKMAVRRVYFHLTQGRRHEVVDCDLSDYFTTIPHGPLLKCVARRIADGQVLAGIKRWLEAPVMERLKRGYQRRTEARDTPRGVPQGAVVSPLLANLYFRRFLLAWSKFGRDRRLDASVVNYADDFVICCRPGQGDAAMGAMRRLMARLGLQVNERKTRLARLPETCFDFLGYTFGQWYGRNGQAFIGTRPSKKAVSRVIGRIREETARRWLTSSVAKRVEELNAVLRGWCGYFDQGPVHHTHRRIQQYTERRLRRWLMRKHKRRGTGYRQYPDEYLYQTLGLFQPPGQSKSRSSAKT